MLGDLKLPCTLMGILCGRWEALELGGDKSQEPSTIV
jgi:hypothetical protein